MRRPGQKADRGFFPPSPTQERQSTEREAPLTEPPAPPGLLLPCALSLAPSLSNSHPLSGQLLDLSLSPHHRRPPSSCLSVCLSASHPTSSLCLCLCPSLSPLCLGLFPSLRPPYLPSTATAPRLPPQVCLSLPQWLQWFGQAQLPSAQMTSLPHHTHAHMHSVAHASAHRCTLHTHPSTHTRTNAQAGFHSQSEGSPPSRS